MGTPIEPSGDEVQVVEEDNSGHNPAWDEVLSVLPEQFHSVVTPHFQKWDSAANQRVESVNGQLSAFESYKPFVEHGISAEDVEQGIRLMYEVNNNPQSVYDALQKAYNFGQAPNAATPVANNGESEEEAEPNSDPRYNRLNEGLELVSRIVLNDAQAKQAAQADSALDSELNQLKEKIGDYDERYVLALMQSGLSAEQAGDAWAGLQQQFQPKPFAPSILSGNNGGGSGLPSNAIDPAKLSSKDTRGLVAQMLQQAANQS